jgi:tRNA pseudouridine38-40 synthase
VPRYKLTIGYDGTDFCGWQKQEPPEAAGVAPEKVLSAPAEPTPGGPLAPGRIELRTVQAVVERAVREVVREPVELIGASRTDSGVHARAQVAAFTCSGEGGTDRTGWPVSRGTEPLLRAINSRLPEDVLVLAADEVPAGFNPIGDCTAKGYSYTLHLSPHRPLWERRFVHHLWIPLDVAAMQGAAQRFVGEHDFAAFAAAGHGRLSTVRTIFDCRVIEESPPASAPEPGGPGRRLRIEVSGNGFLWHMVRIIAGTLVEVGRGKLAPDRVAAIIESMDRQRAGPTLPPRGLCLEWVRYHQRPA